MQYYWRCQYNDGTYFPATQEESKRMSQTYSDIEQDKLIFFEVYKRETDNLVLQTHFHDQDRQLIHVRRILKHTQKSDEKIWLVGWQKTVNGKNVQSINLIFEDGHIEAIGEWGNPPYDKPNQAK